MNHDVVAGDELPSSDDDVPDLYPPVVEPAVLPKTAHLPIHAATTAAPKVPHVSGFLKTVTMATLLIFMLACVIRFWVVSTDTIVDFQSLRGYVQTVLCAGSGILYKTPAGSRCSFIGGGFLLLVFLSPVCLGNGASIELQTPGQPATVLKQGFDRYRNRHAFSSPGMSTFLETESSAFMISQGDPSDFAPKWCVDSGANGSISNCIADFTSNYREVNINITVAKQNITMQAIGI